MTNDQQPLEDSSDLNSPLESQNTNEQESSITEISEALRLSREANEISRSEFLASREDSKKEFKQNRIVFIVSSIIAAIGLGVGAIGSYIAYETLEATRTQLNLAMQDKEESKNREELLQKELHNEKLYQNKKDSIREARQNQYQERLLNSQETAFTNEKLFYSNQNRLNWLQSRPNLELVSAKIDDFFKRDSGQMFFTTKFINTGSYDAHVRDIIGFKINGSTAKRLKYITFSPTRDYDIQARIASFEKTKQFNFDSSYYIPTLERSFFLKDIPMTQFETYMEFVIFANISDGIFSFPISTVYCITCETSPVPYGFKFVCKERHTPSITDRMSTAALKTLYKESPFPKLGKSYESFIHDYFHIPL